MSKLLIEAAACLADVLDRENAALKVMDLRRATALLPEKTAAIAALTATGEAVDGTAPPGLLAAVGRLDAVMSENRQLLERAITAQRRVIGIVVRAAVAATASTPPYGSRRQPRSAGPMAISTRV